MSNNNNIKAAISQPIIAGSEILINIKYLLNTN